MSQTPNSSDISELCRAIRESVGDAVNKAAHSPEMQEIKDTVKSVTREIADEISVSVREGVDSARPYRAPHARQPHVRPPRVRVYDTPPPSPPNPPSAPEVSGPPVWRGSTTGMQIKGNAMSFLGIVGATAGLALAGMVVLAALKTAVSVTAAVAMSLFGLIPLGIVLSGILLTKRGIGLYGTAVRYRKYLAAIGDDRFCAVKLLAEAAGKKAKFVVKDLQRMIRLGMFPEGQLDTSQSNLILDMDTYRQYQTAQQRMEDCRRQEEEAAKKASQPAPPPQQVSDLSAALSDGQEYIRRMREANEKIAGEEMSRKIDRIEQVCRKIFEYVEQHPDRLPDIRRFMSYYLPITLKLLEGYCKFDSQQVQGDNITTAKKEIEETLDTIIMAFENLLDSLFQSEAMDLSSDISTLEAMLAQEGLMGSDFKTASQPQEP